MVFLIQLWKLLAAHAVTDCLLQDTKFSSVAAKKRRKRFNENPEDTFLRGADPDWMYWLWSHGCLQGIGVWIVTGIPLLGLMEAVAHSIIDHFKCENVYGLHVDQALHFICKLTWCVLAIWVLR